MNINGGFKTKREFLSEATYAKEWKLLEDFQKISILTELVDELMEELQTKDKKEYEKKERGL